MIRWRPLELITQNFVWKLAALASAVLIWALVASEPELATFTTVRLEFRNLPDNLEISSAPMETVTLELRGPAGELRGQGEVRRPAVVLDMTNATPGQKTFEIGDGNLSLPRGVTLVRSVPSEVRFDFEQRATRLVAVQVRFTDPQLVAGYEADPKQLPISGPASHVARITTVVTDPIDTAAAKNKNQFGVNAFLSDPFVRFVSSPQVVVTVTRKR